MLNIIPMDVINSNVILKQ